MITLGETGVKQMGGSRQGQSTLLCIFTQSFHCIELKWVCLVIPSEQEGPLAGDRLESPVVVMSHGCAKQVVGVVLTHTTMTHCGTGRTHEWATFNSAPWSIQRPDDDLQRWHKFPKLLALRT